jgi:geranyl-CoA carboxylase alpha subunit
MSTTPIDTLLIANRGEIACRIMRTAKAMGIATVAVHSDADADAPHVKLADRALRIGPAPVAESYLDAARILEAARASGADAIHPGYGFLSENAGFAEACAGAGLAFVGPPAEAIRVMGDKARAKRAMLVAGVPCVPGYQDEDQSDERLIAEAEKIGLPVMVKAAAGGGGRGMRLVSDAGALPNAIVDARSEAANAFGSGELIIEKAIVAPRHVEVQVFADAHGTCIHLGERDCSVQRRHQKVIEEAPCPVMTPELRAAMGAAAVDAARAVDYRGAGTVEFLLDAEGNFFFLEMNTRLQVEHPVTEEVTGLDLVELQLRVARGEPLGIAQDEVALTGHAIEVRLYAEDPAGDFLPSTGPVKLWQPPAGAGIRVDAGIATGGEISPFYDPMVAKIVATGATREEARRRLIAALGATALFGPKTNRDFLIEALAQPVFAAGAATTDFIAETWGAGPDEAPPSAAELALAAALQHALGRRNAEAEALGVAPELLEWSSTGDPESVVVYAAGETPAVLKVAPLGGERYRVSRDEDVNEVAVLELALPRVRLELDGARLAVTCHAEAGGGLQIATPRRSFAVADLSVRIEDEAGGSGRVTAPMHGKLLSIEVGEGEAVNRGDRLAVLEAMKMQHEIRAGIDGTVIAIAASAGAQIAADDLILEIAPAEAAE